MSLSELIWFDCAVCGRQEMFAKVMEPLTKEEKQSLTELFRFTHKKQKHST